MVVLDGFVLAVAVAFGCCVFGSYCWFGIVVRAAVVAVVVVAITRVCVCLPLSLSLSLSLYLSACVCACIVAGFVVVMLASSF